MSVDSDRALNAALTQLGWVLIDVKRLRSLLAAAERVIMEHHSSATHRAQPGTICEVCAGEHETVQAIWKELHST
jgi:hypothetical protein